ncbi:MAG: efflux RND transporter periplasmic adaptor subunit [Myxococcota bacterium]|nr:efflux RND transporter periplasmic adaptor subunit [Myxococcota bacterium]
MARIGVSAVVLGLAGGLVVLALWLFRTSPAAEAQRAAEERRAAAREQPDAQGEAAPVGQPEAGPPSLVVDAVTVRAAPARLRVERTGMLEARRTVVIGAEVAGRVVEVPSEEHTAVGAGEVIVRLDPALPRVAVERAQAALLSAEASARLARAELARSQELTRKGVTSSAAQERAEAEERTGDAAVAQARAALHDAETRLEKTEIRAPFAGVLSSLDLEPGAYLRPGDRVAELADLAEIEIEVGVSDEEILALRDGDPAGVTVEALPGQRFAGRVHRPGRTADARTRKYPVPVRVPNPDGALLPGMLGTVTFELGGEQPALRVPRRAVGREFDLEFVYVLEAPDGEAVSARAQRRRVATRPVPFRPELLEVRDGLEPGERVALSGLRELRDGLLVRVRDTGPGPELAGTAP